MNDKELLPCPFCGSTMLKIDSKRTFAHGGKKHCSVTVRCQKCHARSPVVGIMRKDGEFDERERCEAEVTEAWNKRYVPPAKTLGDAELVRSMRLCVDVKCNSGCQLHDEVACRNVLITKALDLINRQKAEIDRLQVGEYRHISKTVSNARIEAIEDFAEKLKEKIDDPRTFGEDSIAVEIIIDRIDNLVKEMTEGKNDGT